MHASSEVFSDSILSYAWEHAPVFLACFKSDGSLSEANRYAIERLGEGDSWTFNRIFVDFNGTLSLDKLAEQAGPHQLDIVCAEGPPLTHLCHVQKVQDGYIVCGAVNFQEAVGIQEQILTLNRQISNTSRELQKSNAELAVLNRLKNQFLGMAAHDLRKPTGIIETYVGFLLDESSEVLDAEHVGFLKTIREMGRGMSRLIDDFLDVSIIESGKLELHLESTRIESVIDRVRTLIEPSAQRAGVTLDVELAESIPELVVDTGKIEQVLANLLSNAVEYSPEGSPILIRARAVDDAVEVTVQDHGAGISNDQKRTLFNAFARGKTPKAGSQRSIGLGLMISKKIVDAHNGQIQVESKVGQGSTFVVSLPRSGPEDE